MTASGIRARAERLQNKGISRRQKEGPQLRELRISGKITMLFVGPRISLWEMRFETKGLLSLLRANRAERNRPGFMDITMITVSRLKLGGFALNAIPNGIDITILMVIELNDFDMLVCNLIGRLRALTSRFLGVHDAKIGPQSGIDGDIVGMMGEWAFAKWRNVFPLLDLNPRSGSYDGILDGFRYDIKATEYKTGRLICTLKENPDIDIYVLAIVDRKANTVYFPGFARKRDLRRDENITDLSGRGKGYALDQDKLTRFK